MSMFTIGIIGIIVLLVLIFLGMNIGMALMAVGFWGYIAAVNLPAANVVLSTVPSTQASSYSMMVVPLFILMGNYAYHAHLSDGLFDFFKKWLSRIPGNLACATIAACAGFGAICGSTPATCAGMGAVALPEMRKENYDDKLSTGAIAFGGTLGIMIPPSTPMILYAVLTTTSISAMFSAGIPGLLQVAMGIVFVVIWCKLVPNLAPPACSTPWKVRFASIKGVLGVVILFGIVLGGMFSGWFSVAQASAIGAFLAFLMLIFPGKNFNWKTIKLGLQDCASTFGMSFLIIVGASVFSSFLAITKVPMTLANMIGDMDVNRYVIILMITLIYILLGMMMDGLAMMMMTVPIFWPIVQSLGFSAIWFGIYIILVINFGSISPPVGMCCFVVKGLDKKISLGTVYKGVLPFIAALVITILIVMFIPSIATCMPQWLGLPMS